MKIGEELIVTGDRGDEEFAFECDVRGDAAVLARHLAKTDDPNTGRPYATGFCQYPLTVEQARAILDAAGSDFDPNVKAWSLNVRSLYLR